MNENMDPNVSAIVDTIIDKVKESGSIKYKTIVESLKSYEIDSDTFDDILQKIRNANIEILDFGTKSSLYESAGEDDFELMKFDSIEQFASLAIREDDPDLYDEPTEFDLEKEELEEYIDDIKDLSLEGISIDDPVRMYLKEIGKVQPL